MAGTANVTPNYLFDLFDPPQATRVDSPLSETWPQKVGEKVLKDEVLEEFGAKFQNSAMVLAVLTEGCVSAQGIKDFLMLMEGEVTKSLG